MARTGKKRDFGAENLKIACEHLKGLLSDPAVLKALPEGKRVNMIALPTDDPAFLQHNLELLARSIARSMPPGVTANISVELVGKPHGTAKGTEARDADEVANWQLTTA